MKKFLLTSTILIQYFSIFISSIIFIIFYISFDISIYHKFYSQENLAYHLNITTEQLNSYTSNLLNYIKTDIALDSSWFTKKDILHMVDVRNLYLQTYNIALYSIIIFLLLFIINILIFKKCYITMFLQLFNNSIILFSIFIIAIASFVAINFNKFWIKFHEILFSNDLWLLSPSESNLIKMFPEQFFFSLVTKIIIFIICFFIFLYFIKLIVTKLLKI